MTDDRLIYRTADANTEVFSTIVNAIAQAQGCEPAEVGFNLNDYTDIDAIERFVAGTGSGHVRINIGSLLVFVYATGDVVVLT